MSTVSTIGDLLGQFLAAIGGGVLVAYGIFRFMGENWLKHQLAKDLEAAKSEISLLAVRKMKLHDHEYTVFPEIWRRLNRAYASLGGAVSLLKEIPDFSRMNDDEFTNWLDSSKLSVKERDSLSSAKDKNKTYIRILDFQALQRAHEDFLNFHTYFNENRIFISPDIKKELEQIDDLIWSVWLDKNLSLDEDVGKERRKFSRDAWKKYKEKVKPAMNEIEELFQQNIFPEATRGKLL